MSSAIKKLLFFVFLLSGFCSLLYQVVWIRLAFAAFGVITPVLSVVLSVFMMGLGLGSWLAGRGIGPFTEKTGISAIWIYGITELLIGAGGLLVPVLFRIGEEFLLPLGEMASLTYLLVSAVILGLSILPWCVCMGATIPLILAYIKEHNPRENSGFSYLYLANVIGAMSGTVLTAAVLIEWLGFRHTSWIAVAGNVLICILSFSAGLFGRPSEKGSRTEEFPAALFGQADAGERTTGTSTRVILFTTGFIAMALEVVWTRAFTPVLKTTIYSFAALLATYMLSTWVGSFSYRVHLRRGRSLGVQALLALLILFSFLPLFLNDPRLTAPSLIKAVLVLCSIVPFCALLGYLTPKLIDQYAAGAPAKAGAAYAVNVIGCILGPLMAGYFFLPFLGVKYSLILLSLPLIGVYVLRIHDLRTFLRSALPILLAAGVLAAASFKVRTYEDSIFYRNSVIRRDHVATVIAEGEGLKKELYVNGISMTYMTPITKIMAHVPLNNLSHKPRSALVICLGMGTTFRSAAAWDIDVTAVELVPGVRDVFGFFFADAGAVLGKDNVRIVVDDGRRFLKRTSRQFDVIAIDPPPPVEAAGSSLLYSEEFYGLLKTRLEKGGILAQWFPGGEKLTLQAVANSLRKSFPYVRVFHSVEDWGFHLFASMDPITLQSPRDFAASLPLKAVQDFMEWNPDKDVEKYYSQIIQREIKLDEILPPGTEPSVTDDRPYNEYFLMRRAWNKIRGHHESAH